METQVKSEFLSQIGLDSFDIGYVVVGLLIVTVLILILLIIQIKRTGKLKRRLDKFLLGKEGNSLEEDIRELEKGIDVVGIQENRDDIRTIFKRMESVFQKMGLVKYDAFNQMGGQLSYSLVLLDENDNGFIINSVHSTEGCYSYSKEIRNGENNISLSAEEAEALAIAKGK